MILPDHEIRRLCLQHSLVKPFREELLNPASLDLTLGERLLVEQEEHECLQIHSIADCTADQPFLLMPGQFVLAETAETFNLPNHVAGQFVLKSSRAREGLEHLLAGYCDPGWNGSRLTLELQNARRYHPVRLWPGMKIGQMVFHLISGVVERSYAITGRYNGDSAVTASKG